MFLTSLCFDTFLMAMMKNPVVKLQCSDYGYDCAYFSSDRNMSVVINNFQKHVSDKHFIDYSYEAVLQFILRKR